MIRYLRKLWRQEDGTLIFEFLVFAPLMFWTFIATLAYFDLYRTESVSAKAAMTVADMMSREQAYITDAYVDGAHDLLTFLTRADPDPGMRISVLRFHDKASVVNADDATDHYHVVWSAVRGNAEQGVMTSEQARTLSPKLPRMADGDRIILVETWTHYTSAYNLGLATLYGYRKSINAAGQVVDDPGGKEVPEIKDIVMETFVFNPSRHMQTCFKNPSWPESSRLC